MNMVMTGALCVYGTGFPWDDHSHGFFCQGSRQLHGGHASTGGRCGRP